MDTFARYSIMRQRQIPWCVVAMPSVLDGAQYATYINCAEMPGNGQPNLEQCPPKKIMSCWCTKVRVLSVASSICSHYCKAVTHATQSNNITNCNEICPWEVCSMHHTLNWLRCHNVRTIYRLANWLKSLHGNTTSCWLQQLDQKTFNVDSEK